MKTPTPKTWAEATVPTPEQLADWLEVCDRAELIEFCDSAISAIEFVASEVMRPRP